MTDPSTKDAQVSLRLTAGLKDRIEDYARLTGRSKSFVVMEALSDYLDWRLPQMHDLEEALAAADRGEFAAEAEVADVFARYGAPLAAAPTPAPPATVTAAAPVTRRRKLP